MGVDVTTLSGQENRWQENRFWPNQSARTRAPEPEPHGGICQKFLARSFWPEVFGQKFLARSFWPEVFGQKFLESVAHGVQAVRPLGQTWCFQRDIQWHLAGSAYGLGHGGRHHLQGSSPWTRRGKGGAKVRLSGACAGAITSKILLMCDALGTMVDCDLLPPQRHDSVGVAELIPGWDLAGFIPDTPLRRWANADLRSS